MIEDQKKQVKQMKESKGALKKKIISSMHIKSKKSAHNQDELFITG